MAEKTYHQHCGLARALDVVGERWTLLIVRELLLGPRRYSQLLEALDGLTTNLLADRLKRMQERGILEKTPAGYRLTEAGEELEPAILALGRWGGRFMAQPGPGDRRNLAWALISLKRQYPGGQRLTVEIDTGERVFTLLFQPDRLVVREQPAAGPDVRLKGSEEAFFQLLFGDRDEALRQIGLSGDRTALLQALGPNPTPRS